jgi:hypothetical protein
MKRDISEETTHHAFETQLIDEASSATGDRLPYEDLLAERARLLDQMYIPAADKTTNPVMFFNQQRQLVHANPAALRDIIRREMKDSLGLRLGEAFGCNHKMMSIPGEVYKCQDCNSMLSLRTALEGRHASETRHLLMHPGDSPERTVYHVSAIPVSSGDEHLAMMVFEKIDDPTAV